MFCGCSFVTFRTFGRYLVHQVWTGRVKVAAAAAALRRGRPRPSAGAARRGDPRRCGRPRGREAAWRKWVDAQRVSFFFWMDGRMYRHKGFRAAGGETGNSCYCSGKEEEETKTSRRRADHELPPWPPYPVEAHWPETRWIWRPAEEEEGRDFLALILSGTFSTGVTGGARPFTPPPDALAITRIHAVDVNSLGWRVGSHHFSS